MQPDWLKHYFTPAHDHQHHGPPCEEGHGHGADETQQDTGVSRRDFVKTGFVAGMAAGMAAGGVIGTPPAAEAQADNILGGKWWPSPWGPDDEVGASNRITPAKVLEAAKLIKTGKIYRLGMNLEAGMPLFGARHVSITIPGGPTGGPFGDQKLMYNDEMFSGSVCRPHGACGPAHMRNFDTP
jgi:hypothetical protein